MNMSKGLLVEYPKIEEPLTTEMEEGILKNFKNCTGFALFFWDRSVDKGSSSIHQINPIELASIIKGTIDTFPAVGEVLSMVGMNLLTSSRKPWYRRLLGL